MARIPPVPARKGQINPEADPMADTTPGVDPIRRALEARLAQLEREAEDLNQSYARALEMSEGKRKRARLSELEGKRDSLDTARKEVIKELRAYKTADELEAESDDRLGWAGMGIGLGAGAGAVATGLGAADLYLRRKKLGTVLNALENLTARPGIAGTKAGDDVAALVNQGYRLGNAPLPIVASRGTISAARLPRHAPAPFERAPSLPTDKVVPLVAYGDAALMGYRAYGPEGLPGVATTPEGREFAENAMLLGLGTGTMYKMTRAGGKTLLPKPEPADVAKLQSAGQQLLRELDPAASVKQLTDALQAEAAKDAARHAHRVALAQNQAQAAAQIKALKQQPLPPQGPHPGQAHIPAQGTGAVGPGQPVPVQGGVPQGGMPNPQPLPPQGAVLGPQNLPPLQHTRKRPVSSYTPQHQTIAHRVFNDAVGSGQPLDANTILARINSEFIANGLKPVPYRTLAAKVLQSVQAHRAGTQALGGRGQLAVPMAAGTGAGLLGLEYEDPDSYVAPYLLE